MRTIPKYMNHKKIKKGIKYIRRLGAYQGLRTKFLFIFKKRGLIKIRLKENHIFARAKTTDLYAFDQIFIEEEYKLPIKIKPKLIIDAGANAGYASYYFAQTYPNAQIIAVEPEESNFKILTKNLSKQKNIKLIKSAIWSKNTYLKIRNKTSQKWSFRVEETNNKKDAFKSITISEILKKSKHTEIDILKLDIEGAEKEVFSKNFKPWLSKTNIIIIEFHEGYSPGCRKVFHNAIKKYNFKAFNNGENEIFIKEHAIR